jgi:hypothetical protein
MLAEACGKVPQASGEARDTLEAWRGSRHL